MIVGQYRIIEKLGEGGMGIVYRAEHITLEQTVAIKSLSDSLSSDPEMHGRFVREARIQAKLNHPNIVNLYNFFEENGKFYLVMEYVEGETLESMIKRLGQVSIEICLSLFKQVLNAFSYAHARGIIHRDIKPGNIMIKEEGQVKITDFGVAKIASDFKMTQTDIKIGTLYYMSPEYLKGEPVSLHSDLYSLGVTLYQMITGKLPFTGDTEYKLLKAIVETDPPLPREFYPTIPHVLEKIILKAIAKSPVDRFQNAAEFAEALNDFESAFVLPSILDGEATSSIFKNQKKQGYTTQKVVRRFTSSGKVIWATAIAFGIIVGGGFYFFYPFIGTDSKNTPSNSQGLKPDTGISITTETLPKVAPLEPFSPPQKESSEFMKEFSDQPSETKKNRGGMPNRRVEKSPDAKRNEKVARPTPDVTKMPKDRTISPTAEKFTEVPPQLPAPPVVKEEKSPTAEKVEEVSLRPPKTPINKEEKNITPPSEKTADGPRRGWDRRTGEAPPVNAGSWGSGVLKE